MDDFTLHSRLEADTHPIGDFGLCRVLLMNDARFPWVILVPRRAQLTEIHQLTRDDRYRLLDESCAVAEALEALYTPDKLNIGALGNLVPQLHLHHIARYSVDPAWPGPVWGHSSAVAYEPGPLQDRINELRSLFRISGLQDNKRLA